MPAGNQHPPGRIGVRPSPPLAGGARLPAGDVAVAAQRGAVFPDLLQRWPGGDQDDVIVAVEPGLRLPVSVPRATGLHVRRRQDAR
jgi:hypothetical protein